MSKNNSFELYDGQGNIEGGNATSNMTQEEILMNESDILAGLLDLGKTKDESANYKKIQIKRDGVTKLEFRVRPLTEDESQRCLRSAHRYAPTKPGQPRVVLETDGAKYRSYLIYAATVDEDRMKVWENKKAQDAFGVFQGVDMIDRVLLAGEKSRVIEVINEISGFTSEFEETARD